MKTKVFVVLFTVLLAAGPASFAGDHQGPFKGWVEEVAVQLGIDPLDYPYLVEIIDQFGPPHWTVLTTYEGNNNVGGKSTHESAQMFYLIPLPDFSTYIFWFYVDETITVANGDKIFVKGSGVFNASIYRQVDKGIIYGGTGRFEEAEGEKTTVNFSDEHIGDFEGYINY